MHRDGDRMKEMQR